MDNRWENGPLARPVLHLAPQRSIKRRESKRVDGRPLLVHKELFTENVS
jgi:hypothetical protein